MAQGMDFSVVPVDRTEEFAPQPEVDQSEAAVSARKRDGCFILREAVQRIQANTLDAGVLREGLRLCVLTEADRRLHNVAVAQLQAMEYVDEELARVPRVDDEIMDERCSRFLQLSKDIERTTEDETLRRAQLLAHRTFKIDELELPQTETEWMVYVMTDYWLATTKWNSHLRELLSPEDRALVDSGENRILNPRTSSSIREGDDWFASLFRQPEKRDDTW
ncbi:MAG: hypothetical protein MHM6MM_001039 [Cercozoa sp. M6MM]